MRDIDPSDIAIQERLFSSLSDLSDYDSADDDLPEEAPAASVQVRVTTLCSGSSGNAQLVEFGEACFLVDAGIGKAALIAALAEIGRTPAQLTAVLLTHEHRDHTSGVTWLATRQRIPVYATEGTWRGDLKGPLPGIRSRSTVSANIVVSGEGFDLEGVRILPFGTSHDALEPCGYRFRAYGRTVAIATDLGYVSEGVLRCLLDCQLIILEANHDVEMLKRGPYPWFLKKRILSDRGHLSNEATGRALADVLENCNRARGKLTPTVILAHLSAENNTCELAYDTVAEVLSLRGLCVGSDVSLHVANRYCMTGPVAVV